MIDSMIEPLIYEVQVALLGLKKTEELQYMSHSEGSMTPALKSVVIKDSRPIIGAFAHNDFCTRKCSFRWAKAAISSTLRTGSLNAYFKVVSYINIPPLLQELVRRYLPVPSGNVLLALVLCPEQD